MLHDLWRNYRPNKGSTRLRTHARCPTLVQGASQSRVVRLRHNLISNSLSIILSQWMVWILVFYPRCNTLLIRQKITPIFLLIYAYFYAYIYSYIRPTSDASLDGL